jgi:hypothetical protein
MPQRTAQELGQRMSNPRIKPRFNLLRLDETSFWAEQVVRRAKQVFGLYVFDQNRRVHCCEFTPSYECLFVGSAIGNTDLDGTDAERLDAEIREGDLGTEPVKYIHCQEIDALPRISEQDLNVGVADLGIEDEEEFLEYVRRRVL